MADKTLTIRIEGAGKMLDEDMVRQEEFRIPKGTKKIKFVAQQTQNLWVDRDGFLEGVPAHHMFGITGTKVVDLADGLSADAVCLFDVGDTDPFDERTRAIHPCMIVEE